VDNKDNNGGQTDGAEEFKKVYKPPKRAKSGRINALNYENKELKNWTCRKCLQRRLLTDYYAATDPIDIAGTGRMSVCRFCVEEIYNSHYSSENSLEKAIYKTCKLLNVKYDSRAIESTKAQIETNNQRGRVNKTVFGVYRKNLNIIDNSFASGVNTLKDVSFQEGVKYDAPPLDSDEYAELDAEELVAFWGKGLEADEYSFLELELDRYKRTHKCDTAAEESLLRQICFCELEIRKSREEDKSASSAIKQLQDLMKTASVDPAKTAMAGGGKSQDTFSAFIKTIEENEPAEYFKDKDLFKDFDNIGKYFEKYVSRPLKNFVTLSRDFNVDDEEEDDDFDVREASEE